MTTSVFPMSVPGRTGFGALREALADRRKQIEVSVDRQGADAFLGGGTEAITAELIRSLTMDEFTWSEPEILDGVRSQRTYECTDVRCREVRMPGSTGSHRHSDDMAHAVVDVSQGDMSLLQFQPSGSRPPLDQEFISAAGRQITIRFFPGDAAFAREIHSNLCSHFEAANSDVAQHNSLVPEAVERCVERRRARLAREEKAIDAIGWARRSSAGPRLEYRLPDAQRRDTLPRPSPPEDEANFQLSRDDFAEVVKCIAGWANDAERLPGVAAGRGEDQLRNALLSTLNARFVDATGEAFSATGKTDIRVLVRTAEGRAGPQLFHAECKVWAGPASVDDAVDQLVRKYSTHRDRLGALIFFVVDRVDLAAIGPKARQRLVNEHGGSALPPVAGWPMVQIPSPNDLGQTVELAVVAVHIPHGARAESHDPPATPAAGA